MKIAIASNQGQVSQHFGHCESFVIYNVENDKIISRNDVANPGHRPGVLPIFLSDLGVNVIVSGGMGEGAIQIFDAHKIAVVTGATGTVDSVIQKWISKELKSTGSVCNEHMNHGNC